MASSITSLGIGTGLDLNSVLTKLMSAEQQPLLRLESKLTSTNSKLSTFGRLKSALEDLRSAANKLSNPFNMGTTSATVSNTDVASATVDFSATTGTYALTVSTLAASAKRVTNPFSSVSTFSPGTLSFNVGGASKQVVLNDQTSYTLQEVRSKINDANIGVTATVVSGTAGDRLVITANTTGLTAGNFSLVSVTDSGGTGSLALSALNSFDTGLERNSADAEIEIDGIPVSSTSNAITSAVSGLTINLASTGTTTITVKDDPALVTKAVQAFVDAYNSINTVVKSNSAYDQTSRKAQPLNGEIAVTNVLSALTSARTTVPASLSGGTYETLSALGVSIQQDGSLKLDSTALSSAVTSNPTEVLKTLNAYGSSFYSTIDALVGTGGIVQSKIDGLNAQIKQYNENKASLQVRLDNVEKRYRAQFTALDRLVSSLNTTSSYLSQQLAQYSK